MRAPEVVLGDVLDGYITSEIAERLYGVAITLDPPKIDSTKTQRLRED
jgi:hypothetical protein